MPSRRPNRCRRVRGPTITLEPLAVGHARELWPAADDPDMRRLWPRRWESLEDVVAQFDYLLRARNGDAEPFLIRRHGIAIGSTSFYNIEATEACIGWTFLIPAARGTGANRESKWMMLKDAFDHREWEKVTFQVDVRNTRSRRAVLGLGATEERIIERHMTLWDGHVRDTVVFSIERQAWPAVEARLRPH